MGCALDAPTMACELEFEAPDTPGEYKVMVHVRSCGCVGVDVRRKVSFQVLRPLDRNTTSSSSGASSGDPVETGADGAAADKMSALREFDDLPPPLEGSEGEEPPPLTIS